jgi:glycosyltransferase involved in cell wall biosynthesis
MLVSIGLPTYNRASLLPKSLESLLNQTHADFELLISDNHSTDNTASVVRSYANKDSRIKYYYQAKPLSAIQNAHFVLHKAKGRYFFWASDDDLWEPEFIEKTLAQHRKQDILLAAPLWKVMDQRGRVRNTPLPLHWAGKKISLYDYFIEGFNHYKGNLYWGLYHRKKLIEAIRRYPLPPLPHNDLFTIGAVLSSGDVYVLKESLFIKQEYFSDARKECYSFIQRIVDIATSSIVWWRIGLNLLLPHRVVYVYRVASIYFWHCYNLSLVNGYPFISRLYLSLLATLFFVAHVIPNDLDLYQKRQRVFCGV